MVALVLDGLVGFPAGLSPTSFHLSPSSFHLSPKLGACGRVPGLVSHFLSFVSQFFSFVSQFLSFVSPGWVLVVGFPAGLSPTSFHLSPTSFHLSPRLGACGRVPGWLVSHFLSFVSGFPAGLSPTSFHLSPSSFHLSPKLGACGRVPGLVSHFLSFVSQFFSFVSQFLSFVSQAGCLWSGSRLACLPLPFICPLPLLFICLPVLFICLPGWVLVVGFPAGLSPTSFHMSPTSFHFLSPRLGACGRVPGWLVSYFLSFVSHFFSFFVSQAGCLWSGSRLACLPLPFICLPLLFICLPGFPAGLSPTSCHLSPTSFHLSPSWVLVVGFPAGLSPTSGHLCPTSFHLSPRLGACGRVPGWLVSHFLSFVSGFPAGLSRTSFHLSPTSFHLSPFLSFLCLPGSVLVVGFPLVSHFLSHFFSFVSQFFSLSPRLGACGRVCGWLVSHVVSFVSHFFSFVSHFFSFVSQAGCLWSGSRLACLLLPVICLPLLFIFCLPGWVLVVGFPAGLSRTFLSFVSFPFICLSPRLGACGRVPACLPLPFPLLFICLPVLFIVSQAGCLWSRVCGWLVSHVVSFVIFVSHFFSLSIHLSSRSVAGGVRPFPMSMQHVY